MSDKEFTEAQIKALEASVAYYAPGNKKEREIWVANSFLENLAITFTEAELLPMPEDHDPPDVLFRGARFEIKEILDPGRRRHDEYKQMLKKARRATSASELFKHFTPVDLTIGQVYGLCLDEVRKRATKYDPRTLKTLDLLLYVNLEHVAEVVPEPFPETAQLLSFGWRSVSF